MKPSHYSLIGQALKHFVALMVIFGTKHNMLLLTNCCHKDSSWLLINYSTETQCKHTEKFSVLALPTSTSVPSIQRQHMSRPNKTIFNPSLQHKAVMALLNLNVKNPSQFWIELRQGLADSWITPKCIVT